MDVNSVANRGILLANMPDQILFESGWFRSFSDLVMQFLRSEKKIRDEVITPDLQLFNLLRSNSKALTPGKFKVLSFKYVPELKDSWVDCETPVDEEMEVIGAWWLLDIMLNVFLSNQPWLRFEKLNEFLADEKKAVEVCLKEHDGHSFMSHIRKWIGEDWESEVEFEVKKVLLWLALYEKFNRLTTKGFEQRFADPAMMKMFLPVTENKKLIVSNERYVSAIKQKQVGVEASWILFYETIAKAQQAYYSQENSDRNDAVEKALKRIRSGKGALNRASYTRNLRVLDTELRQEPMQPVELIALFCEVMTKKQTAMLKNGFSPEFIEKTFAAYPEIYARFADEPE